MAQITIDLPDDVLAAMGHDPVAFSRELRIAAAVKWYEMREVSQGFAAEIAGLSRADFLDALNIYGVSPFQYDADEELSNL